MPDAVQPIPPAGVGETTLQMGWWHLFTTRLVSGSQRRDRAGAGRSAQRWSAMEPRRCLIQSCRGKELAPVPSPRRWWLPHAVSSLAPRRGLIPFTEKPVQAPVPGTGARW